MITLLRKIRKNLLSQNKFSSYLLYAIGEILLVVIGILIALQINNLNEKRKASKIENQYLSALKDEFSLNLEETKRVKNLCNSILNSSKKLSSWTGPPPAQISGKEVGIQIANSFAFPPKFIASPGILNDLISSGNLNKIKNHKLRNHIQEWLVIQQEIKEQEDELWEHRNKVMYMMTELGSFRNLFIDIGLIKSLNGFEGRSKFDSDNTLIVQERTFENLLFLYSTIINELNKTNYAKAQKNIISIINEIDTELNP